MKNKWYKIGWAIGVVLGTMVRYAILCLGVWVLWSLIQLYLK